ncbi:alpha/beta fold hydrolase [Xanthobacter agilis]|uniref:Pimeloyl-ACP methyl ester carboxylesterase n=1 Tax=Xanthobacter agilis TaxID=47492 RepID=A0ABU0LCS2_XANAG|nr:alpha/beta hydrolase [Xanthobacter agilis]MDQ0504949.1 pimeloyl-ACP methyl ester carboxylesterase [Xanthobacter agilis]
MSAPLSLPRSFTATTADQLSIHIQDWGSGEGPEMLFIHGFSHCGLAWMRQVGAPALSGFRKVTYDFRGHGGSDKPLDAHFYKEPERWADELATVIAASGLKRPILVGWSYAGRIIGDYLKVHGHAGIGGIVFVDAATANDRAFYGTCNRLMRQMCSADLAQNIDATRAFVRRCFAGEQPQELLETLVALNMVVPAQVRAALFDRPADYEDVLRRLDIPVLVMQGEQDDVVAPAMAHHIAQIVPAARLALFPVGHAPFLEAPDAFNTILADFARGVAT